MWQTFICSLIVFGVLFVVDCVLIYKDKDQLAKDIRELVDYLIVGGVTLAIWVFIAGGIIGWLNEGWKHF